jgi:hypothetical protein
MNALLIRKEPGNEVLPLAGKTYFVQTTGNGSNQGRS